jgi:ADP-dependent NAD(P)H-hydrate dehydratase / NAD(P)H-hydrate epimerase
VKAITAEAMQAADRRTIEERGVPGLQLMETAGVSCTEAIVSRFGTGRRGLVVAGRGNNGGDGYVIARLLAECGWRIGVVVLARPEDITGDALTNLRRVPSDIVIFSPEGLAPHATLLPECDVVVDAVFGTGLKKELSGAYAEAVELINCCGKPVVSVDIPSGIDGSTGRIMGTAIRAAVTVTFAAAKIGHILYPGAEHAGELVLADIGIPVDILDALPGVDFTDFAAAAALANPRSRTAHKGSFGHSLIVAGSRGKTGAAALAATSAVRAGAGLVTLAVPDAVNDILEVKTTEAMTIPVPDGGCGFFTPLSVSAVVEGLAGKDSAAIGPGISWSRESSAFIRELLPLVPVPLIIDADGLNAVSEDPSILLRRRATEAVLTPHPGEMARLCGMSIPEIEADRTGVAASFARQYNVHLVLKGARTVVATPQGEVSINGSGNPGMASGGMGDVLTGILVALLGQGYSASAACRLGVFLHGFAADLVAEEKGEVGITAGDVCDRLPHAYKLLLQEKNRC